MQQITYVSDQAADYTSKLTGADTLPALRALLDEFSELVQDAIAAAPKNDAEFADFRAGLVKERKGQFAGEEWAARFGAVLLPDLLLRVADVALRFGAPWGCAFIRCHEAGKIEIVGNIARWVETPNNK